MSDVSPQNFSRDEIQLMLDNTNTYTLEELEELDKLTGRIRTKRTCRGVLSGFNRVL